MKLNVKFEIMFNIFSNLLGEYVYMDRNDVADYNFWWGSRIAIKKCQILIYQT